MMGWYYYSMSILKLWWVLPIAAMVMLPGCIKNEATGRTQFNLLSSSQEVAMGLAAKPQMVQEFQGSVADPTLNAYVADLGMRLSKVTEGENPNLPWSFTFLNSDVVNAFALPGGQVFITRGLAKKLTNEAQLVGVLGHEIGHVTARHGGERISKQIGFEVVVQGLGAGTGSAELAQLSSQIAELTQLSYSRDQESESDSLGLRYMTKLNYNPIGQQQVMQIFAKMQADAGGSQNEWTATHPDPAKRVKLVGDEIARLYPTTQRDPRFKLNEAEYRSIMLARLALLPPAPDAERVLARRGVGAGLWCAHCREEEDEAKFPNFQMAKLPNEGS